MGRITQRRPIPAPIAREDLAALRLPPHVRLAHPRPRQMRRRNLCAKPYGLQLDFTASRFSAVPLWEAAHLDFSYDSWRANYLQPTPIPFGGWNTPSNMRIGVQQQIEFPLNGVNVDLDSFNANSL